MKQSVKDFNSEGLKASIRILMLALFIGLLFSSLIAEVKISDELNSQEFFVGDGVLWSISVQGATRVDPPTLSSIPGFLIYPLDPQILEQKDAKIFIYRYRIIPRLPGLITLPPVTLMADQQEFKTESRILNVGEPKTTPDLRLEVSFDRNEVFIGQPVLLTFRWLCGLPLTSIKALDIQLPIIYDPNFTVIIPDEERRSAGKPETIGLPIEGQRAIAKLSSLKINEEDFKVLTFQRILIPKKEGDFTIPATKLLCSHLPSSNSGKKQAFTYPSFFNNDFFEETSNNEKFLRFGAISEASTLKVKPLPELNRPADFSGIVGHGEMLLDADPVKITIGDPITITVRLRGFETPEAIPLPSIGTLAAFEGQFLIPSQQSPPRVENKESLYLQSIRPLRTAVTEIPSLKLVLFNPDSEQYETLTTQPIAISVRPDGETTSIDLGPETRSNKKTNPEGIWQNSSTKEIDLLSLISLFASRTLLFWTLIPMLFWLSLAKVARNYRLKKSNPVAWRENNAFKVMKKSLHQATLPEQQRSAITDYLSTRLHIKKEAISYHEIQRAIHQKELKLDPALAECLKTVFDLADLAEFNPHTKPSLGLVDYKKIISAIEKLEESIKKS